MVQAVLQFKDYHVIETVYKNNIYFEPDLEAGPISPDFTYGLEFSSKNHKLAKLELGINIGDEDLKNTQYFISAKILGIFEITTDLEQDEKESFLRINGVAILYPYLRSLVSDLTSRGSEAPIILPTMNIAAMLQNHEQLKNQK